VPCVILSCIRQMILDISVTCKGDDAEDSRIQPSEAVMGCAIRTRASMSLLGVAWSWHLECGGSLCLSALPACRLAGHAGLWRTDVPEVARHVLCVVRRSVSRVGVISMEFDFRQKLVEDGEIDEEASSSYAEELIERFAESPEGAALDGRGIEQGHYLYMFLDYALRYIGVSPAEMDKGDVRETLKVMAEKVTARPEDFDLAIPELEGFCDFVGRAFAFEGAVAWKRAIREYAPEFRRAIRDPRRWGMAKSMMMEGISRGFDLSTEESINRWLSTKQAEQIAGIEAGRSQVPGGPMSLLARLRQATGHATAASAFGAGEQAPMDFVIGDLGGGEFDLLGHGSGTSAKRLRKKEKSRRKQAKASRRQSRR
jgi:hypothetical protein